jgi:hypothetical protein
MHNDIVMEILYNILIHKEIARDIDMGMERI